MTFLLESPKGDAAFAKLMAAPVTASRTKIPRAKVAPKASRPSTGTSLADILASKAARRSRSSWPSYRKQTIAALIAAGEFDYLDSLGIFCVRRVDLARVRHEECTA